MSTGMTKCFDAIQTLSQYCDNWDTEKITLCYSLCGETLKLEIDHTCGAGARPGPGINNPWDDPCEQAASTPRIPGVLRLLCKQVARLRSVRWHQPVYKEMDCSGWAVSFFPPREKSTPNLSFLYSDSYLYCCIFCPSFHQGTLRVALSAAGWCLDISQSLPCSQVSCWEVIGLRVCKSGLAYWFCIVVGMNDRLSKQKTPSMDVGGTSQQACCLAVIKLSDFHASL